MTKLLFLNGVSCKGRLGRVLSDARLSGVFETNSIGSVIIPDLDEFVSPSSIDVVVTMVHSDFPSQNGCIGRQAREALRQDRSIQPESFADWVSDFIHESDPFRQVERIGENVARLLPFAEQVLVIYDQCAGIMHPVASRQKGSWHKVNMLWQTAVAMDFEDGIPELPAQYVPKGFRAFLEQNRQTPAGNGGEGHQDTLILNATPRPIESIRSLKSWMGMHSISVSEAAVISCLPKTPGWWVPQMEGILEERKPSTNYLIIARSKAEVAQIAHSLEASYPFQQVLNDHTRSGWIQSFVVEDGAQ